MDEGAFPPSACQSCGHVNPADARFCSSCGGLLIPPAGRVTEAPEPPLSADVARRASRPTSRVLIGVAVVVVAGVLGYEGYAKFSQFFTGVPDSIERTIRYTAPYGGFLPPPAPAGTNDTAATPAENAGASGGSPVTGAVTRPKEIEPAPEPPPAAAPPEPARAESPRLAPVQPAPKSASAPPRETRTVESPPPQRPAQQACTEGTAALGLCTMPQAPAAKPRAEADEPRKAQGAQEQTRKPACPAAAAALGLCPS
jgi:hypothetical protein